MLSSAVGMEASPVTSVVPLQRGDALLLCSDGLTKHVPDSIIAKRVRKGNTAKAASYETRWPKAGATTSRLS